MEAVIYILAVLAIVAAIFPMLTQGVTLNDELQNRFDRKTGLWNMILQNARVHIDKGRPLLLLVDYRFLGFLSENMLIGRIACALLILVNAALLARLLYRLSGDKRFSLFAAFLFIVLLPLTFQHAVPAAFTPLLAVPMLFLELSLLSCMNSYEKPSGKTRFCVLSAVFFFLAMSGYEFIIVYCFLYPLLFIRYTKQSGGRVRFWEMVRACLPQIAAAVAFLVLYFGFSVLLPSSYGGNQIGFVSLKSSWEVMQTLFLSAIPGYFCLSGVSLYQMQIYNGGLLNAGSLLSIGMLLLVAGAVFCSVGFALGGEKRRGAVLWRVLGMGLCLLYMLLPSLPNAVSLMYQGNVTHTSFTALPVSYFLYTAAVLLIVQLLWLLKDAFGRFEKTGAVVICLLVCTLLVPQQALNHVVGRVQTEDYQRLEMIEGVFETNTARVLHGKAVYSENIYQTRNLLAIHDGYWENLAALYGIEADFFTERAEDTAVDKALTVRDECVVIWDAAGGYCYVLSEALLKDVYYLEDPDGYVYRMPSVYPGEDGAYFLYTFVWDIEERTVTAIG